jgi:hypothetical protein
MNDGSGAAHQAGLLAAREEFGVDEEPVRGAITSSHPGGRRQALPLGATSLPTLNSYSCGQLKRGPNGLWTGGPESGGGCVGVGISWAGERTVTSIGYYSGQSRASVLASARARARQEDAGSCSHQLLTLQPCSFRPIRHETAVILFGLDEGCSKLCLKYADEVSCMVSLTREKTRG